jgi:hypothetical protein
LPHPRCTLRLALFKFGKSSSQTKGIELVDGENADTALSASRAADEPMPASSGHIGERSTHDLDQLLICADWIAFPHLVRITQSGVS